MSMQEAYKQEMETELDLVQVKLIEVKAMANGLSAYARVRLARRVDDLEQKINDIHAKLKELSEAGEHTWEDLKDGVAHMRLTLQSTLQDTITNFKD